MKKFKLVTATAALLLLASHMLTACGSSADAGQSKLDQIKASGQLVLGTSADYPPYEFHVIENGQDTIVGFDIAIAQAVADHLGVELVVKDMDFSGLLPALSTGTVDMVIAGMSPTEERKQNVDFSDIYYQAEIGVLVKKDVLASYNDLASLDGKKIGAQQGSIQEEAALKVADAEVRSMPKVLDLVQELENGNIEALIVEKNVGDQLTGKYADLAVAPFSVPVSGSGSAIAIAKGNDEFVAEVNKVIADLLAKDQVSQFYVEADTLFSNQD
ncbi:transporter substrate-binding domain-containing protein [Culicoidibacter larvae]|uniref:Transporter substrate-binding domain-containing protein n=1 Tax=Culicoidibacter larvae TaxID=2579976 RepID=A0A5R8QB10_9FIRM|nr:transporter substrate-binding domain-containing protein [Culicoidibacter larvae]TLG72508.1 transporter substrate-binding domain-containing protein [Culicoidibacter larvae]